MSFFWNRDNQIKDYIFLIILELLEFTVFLARVVMISVVSFESLISNRLHFYFFQ
jgi:hypothetical protein